MIDCQQILREWMKGSRGTIHHSTREAIKKAIKRQAEKDAVFGSETIRDHDVLANASDNLPRRGDLSSQPFEPCELVIIMPVNR